MGARGLGVALVALLLVGAATAGPKPRLQSATVSGDRLTLAFAASPAQRSGRLTVTVNGSVVKPERILLAGKRMQLVLPRAAYSDDVVRVHGVGLRLRGGARIRAFAATAANRSTAGCSLEVGTVHRGGPTEGPTDMATYLPAGRLAILSVEVDYADVPARAPVRQLLQLSAADVWLRELSYGRAGLAETPYGGIVRMPKSFFDYTFSGAWGSRKSFFQDLVLLLDGEIDFSRFDAVFVTTSFSTRQRPFRLDSATIAPAGQGVSADGKELRHFGVFTGGPPERGLWSTLALMGLPSISNTGSWNTFGLLGWHRRKLGWLDPAQTRCLRSGSFETVLAPLSPAGGVKQIVVPTAPDRAFVLENRQPVGLDARNYGCARGILAYDVQTRPTLEPITLHPAVAPGPKEPCGYLSSAAHDFRPGDLTRVADTVTFEVLEVTADGGYRLRLTR